MVTPLIWGLAGATRLPPVLHAHLSF